MRRHTQTIFCAPGRNDGHDAEGNPGNCLQAAVASAFDFEIWEVPHFVMYLSWFESMRLWARGLSGDIAHFNVPLVDEVKEYIDWYAGCSNRPRYILMDGPSPRGDFYHIVVGDLKLNMVHDPHPSGAGLVEVTGIYMLTDPYDPAPTLLELTK
jgi:hypothetical protein